MRQAASSRFPRQPKSIGEADRRYISATNRFGYLIAAQAARLFYPNMQPRDGQREAQRRLGNLSDNKKSTKKGYLQRLRNLETPRYGSAPHVFTVARKGRQYLQALGVDVPDYYRPSEEQEKAWNSWFMSHNLAVVDVLVAAESLCDRFPKYRLLQLETYRELKHRRLKVAIKDPTGKRPDRLAALIPDAWFELEMGQDGPIAVALEVDRDSEEQKSWRRKIAAYAAFVDQPSHSNQLSLYESAFAADNLTIAITTPSLHRRNELIRWTNAELNYRNKSGLSDIFLFTAEDPVTTSPQDFFFADSWHRITGSPISLLDKPEVQGLPVAFDARYSHRIGT